MDISKAIDISKALMEPHRDMTRALKMSRYMQDLFPFYGIPSPLRKQILSAVKKEVSLNSIDECLGFADALWSEDYRELHYIGLDILTARSGGLHNDHLPVLESLITRKSWWDTVDGLASNCIGSVLKNDKDLQKEKSGEWIFSQNLWLQRTAIIFQLKYGNDVNETLLFNHILATKESPDFFIRKAAGWALRQYSKFNASAVRSFIESNKDLSGLTLREARKYL